MRYCLWKVWLNSYQDSNLSQFWLSDIPCWGNLFGIKSVLEKGVSQYVHWMGYVRYEITHYLPLKWPAVPC